MVCADGSVNLLVCVDGEPAGSARIWEKLGYRREATHREAAFHEREFVDVEWYAVLASEWVG